MNAAQPEVLRAIAVRVDAAPSVARRASGAFGTAAAYLPGERIEGLRVRDGRLEVHVVMRWGVNVNTVEKDVRSAVGTSWNAECVDVVIDDIDVPVQPSLVHAA